MPENTRRLVRARAIVYCDEEAAEYLDSRVTLGYTKFGPTNHLTCGEDWIKCALEESADEWLYLCFFEVHGGIVPEEVWRAKSTVLRWLLGMWEVGDG